MKLLLVFFLIASSVMAGVPPGCFETDCVPKNGPTQCPQGYFTHDRKRCIKGMQVFGLRREVCCPRPNGGPVGGPMGGQQGPWGQQGPQNF